VGAEPHLAKGSLSKRFAYVNRKRKSAESEFYFIPSFMRTVLNRSKSTTLTHDIVSDCSTFQICGDRRRLVHLLFLGGATPSTHGETLAVEHGVWWTDCVEFWELPLLAGDPTVVRVNNTADIVLVQLDHSTFQLLFGLGSF
jgi:hypothetical protein